jgi:hypothetical protein
MEDASITVTIQVAAIAVVAGTVMYYAVMERVVKILVALVHFVWRQPGLSSSYDGLLQFL